MSTKTISAEEVAANTPQLGSVTFGELERAVDAIDSGNATPYQCRIVGEYEASEFAKDFAISGHEMQRRAAENFTMLCTAIFSELRSSKRAVSRGQHRRSSGSASPRRRGSRRTSGTRAGPDDDSGGESEPRTCKQCGKGCGATERTCAACRKRKQREREAERSKARDALSRECTEIEWLLEDVEEFIGYLTSIRPWGPTSTEWQREAAGNELADWWALKRKLLSDQLGDQDDYEGTTSHLSAARVFLPKAGAAS
jgi:hypothetical protein